MIEKVLVADVGLDSKIAGVDAVYTYAAGPGVQVGDAHFVSLGTRQIVGFVVDVRETVVGELGFPLSNLKPLGFKVEGMCLPSVTVDLVRETARQTLSPLSAALGLVLPPTAKDRLETVWKLVEGQSLERLSATQRETVRVLSETGGLMDSKVSPLPDHSRRILRALEKKGTVVRTVALLPYAKSKKLAGLLMLTADEKKVEKFLTGVGKRRPAQAMTVMRLQGSEATSLTAQEIKAFTGVTDQTIKALVQAGLLEQGSGSDTPVHRPPTLNAHQDKAVKRILDPLTMGQYREFLLFGVTGSGKTEVYLRAAEQALKLGKQVLYLVPEIALTAQVIAQLRQRFGDQVAVLHSNMSPQERLENWLRVRTGACSVVLGPRSAVFSPLTHLGLIVVDEEHESSYKQDRAPRYQCKKLASYLGKRFGCPVVFGSATPSVEAIYASAEGQVERLDLPTRAASATLPDVSTIDLTILYKEKRTSVISAELESAMRETLSCDKQVILFLNRRAYAPSLVCRDCGHRLDCPHCSVALAFHRRERRTKCHQCGYRDHPPDTCPQCASDKIVPLGTGTERVESSVSDLFPDVAVARLDRDIASRKGALDEILTAFRSGEIRVLVGTQMVAKGLDFPNVTLVGVVAADVSLNIPDFRANERTFQLLSQVAGRAGRGLAKGRVLVQTFNPQSMAVECAVRHDATGFYELEIAQRREANYPPFCRLVNVIVSGESRSAVETVSIEAAKRAEAAMPTSEILGPADCAIERLNNLWRRHVLIKAPPCEDLTPLSAAFGDLGTRAVRIALDVDPANLT
ncbi:MAG: primosomal protein N' [Chthonomonadaceae bacterium]|nr:primosomal protein N' [Chthonomonadaceae bacterium]